MIDPGKEGLWQVATVYDVADKAGVSIATVSRVFNKQNVVSAATQEKVLSAAESLGYTPHIAARSLMMKRTDSIGIILPDIHGEFFSELVRAIDSAARNYGLHLLVSCSHDDADDMAAALAAMRGRVDGIVIMSPLISADVLENQIFSALPVVILNGRGKKTMFPKVNLDNFAGAYKMVNHLISEGHRDICIIGGPSNNLDAEQRQLGCIAATEEDVDRCRLEILEGGFTEGSGYETGRRILAREKLPDVVFALNDSMAIGCLCAFSEHGLIVPQDVALAGFDDIPLARYLSPSLTTVHVPIGELGHKSLEALLELMQADESRPRIGDVVIDPKLIIRDSSRRIKA